MEEILNSLLEKPLAFILAIGGIIFLGLSGLTKFFQIEIDKTNSKRLFIAGLALILVGIPIYYFIDNKDSSELIAELVDTSFYQNYEGHTCNPKMLHVRETFEIDNVNGEKLFKVVLSTDEPIVKEIIYHDKLGRYAIDYCFKRNFDQHFDILLVTNSGKSSKVIDYTIDSNNVNPKENAPSLSKF
jgi:uncharacterized protein YjeT (DUF2065 family)